MIFPRSSAIAWLISLAAFIVHTGAAAAKTREFEAITFATSPGVLYIPAAEASAALRWELALDEAGRCVGVNGISLPAGSLRTLTDGTELLSTIDFTNAGAVVEYDAECAAAMVRWGNRRFTMSAGPKRVEISLAKQRLLAWQGERLVLQSRISSGRRGSTPAGDFRAGPYKARWHRSSRYHNAPMPWSVQIRGHVFIHGFTIVPPYPASHGCIRLPMDGYNPAKLFFEWVDTGTPVRVIREASD